MVRKDSRAKIPIALLWGLGSGLGVSVALAMIGAALIAAEKMGETAVGWMAMLAVFLGSATTALVLTGRVKEKRFVMCMLGAAAYLVGLFCMSAVMFDGVKGGVGATAVLVLGGALVTFLLGKERQRKPKYKSPKQRF